MIPCLIFSFCGRIFDPLMAMKWSYKAVIQPSFIAYCDLVLKPFVATFCGLFVTFLLLHFFSFGGIFVLPFYGCDHGVSQDSFNDEF